MRGTRRTPAAFLGNRNPDDYEDVGDHLVIVGVAVAEEVRGVRRVPGIDALLADRLDDALVDLAIDQQLAASSARRTARSARPTRAGG